MTIDTYADADDYGPPGEEGTPDDVYEATLHHHREVQRRVAQLRIDRDAREVLRLEALADSVPAEIVLLQDKLLEPEVEVSWRVQDLIPARSNTLLVAQFKAGKTTLTLNYAWSLITGLDFLGRFDVTRIGDDRTVAILNYEVDGGMLARWAYEAGVPRDRLVLVNLRGRRNPLYDPDERRRVIQGLRDARVEAVIVDTFGKSFGGASQNDPAEVSRYFAGLDSFTAECGATDTLVTAHAGWNGERVRGSTVLHDWPDAVLTLIRKDEDPHSPRFLSAFGRDVELPEDRLDFHQPTRRLVLSGTGSRKKAKAEGRSAELAVFIRRVLEAAPHQEVVGRAKVEAAIKALDDGPDTLANGEVAKAAEWMEAKGWVEIESLGQGKAKVYRLRGGEVL